MFWLVTLAVVFVLLGLWIFRDIRQKKHAIIHNFPIVGHFRYWLEAVGPELRQYIVTSNNEERPFSRDERRWVYASSKRQNNYFGFGTDNDLETSPNHLIIKHSAFPINDPQPGDFEYDPLHAIPCHRILGGHRNRKFAFRPSSIVNISGMSYGSLSAPAIEAINRGCKLAGALHNTGEGGISSHHKHGGELIWQIGTGYFGCRDASGRFDISRFIETVQSNSVKAIEIKLSQGAKPGQGGVLPAAKITPEIAAIRGIPLDKDCLSPARHSAFHNVDSLLDFVERLADVSGLPIGIKSAVGQLNFWHELAETMSRTSRGVDFITIDGGEGGTGAAPLVFSDHVSLPFKIGFSRVHKIFQEYQLDDAVVFIGSGKLGFPAPALMSFAQGCDMISVAREAMLSIGCIQAQKCQSGHCPAGIATQNKWLMKGLDPTDKSARMANYLITLRKEIMQLCRACGVDHPSRITMDHFEVINPEFTTQELNNRRKQVVQIDANRLVQSSH
ncbi:MAG TPA: FMN-binding glutamate synthase family protein [Pirellulaceae bacterium]|nr:FMN-binding glutamate synthase family protein [Pirellulaceae bacterium]HMO92026.1 FMN-binding glutamate synthase family protein [Pirellulaceae bacterium]HMP68825.1 FMN-binding glutamate synthase family protein [Pirellulaceae bacterium]